MVFVRKAWRAFACSLLIPIVILSALLGVYYPRAPRVSATEIDISSASLQGLTLSLDIDVSLLIANENPGYSFAFDDVDINYYFPSNPNVTIGTGTIPGAILDKGGEVTRTLTSSFQSPISTFGLQFIKDLNAGHSQVAFHGKVHGYSPFLASTYRLASDVNCLITYTWDTRKTTKDCKYDYKVKLATKDSN